MKTIKRKIIALGLICLALASPSAHASVVINEILADPPSGPAGDDNADGKTSSTQDEFIELLNFGTSPMDLSGWIIADALKPRHIFPFGTALSAFQYLVVFGGGQPNLPQIQYQVASEGTLGLNNTNEDVFLYDPSGNLIDHLHYGAEGDKNQSLARSSEGEGTGFVLHSTIPEAQGRIFSPGQSLDGQLRYTPPTDPEIPPTAVPELPVWLYAILGGIMIALQRKERHKIYASAIRPPR